MKLFEAARSRASISNQMKGTFLGMMILGIIVLLAGWIQTSCLMFSSERQINLLREKYFASVIRQNIGFFDTNDTGELNTRMYDDVKKIHDGIGEKVGIAVQSLAQFISGIVIALVYGWKLGLVCISLLPVIGFSGFLFFYFTSSASKEELDDYAEAGAIAQEVLGSIRTVTAFNGQKFEAKRYEMPLLRAQYSGIKKSALVGFSIGFFFLALFLVYAIAFWYGGELVIKDGYDIGTKLIVFFSAVMGGFGLSTLGQNMEYLARVSIMLERVKSPI